MARICRDSDYGPLRWRQSNHDAVNLTLDIGLLSVLQTSIWYFSITFNNKKLLFYYYYYTSLTWRQSNPDAANLPGIWLWTSEMSAIESWCRESDFGQRPFIRAANIHLIFLTWRAFDLWCCFLEDVERRVISTIGCHTINVNYYYLIILNFNN